MTATLTLSPVSADVVADQLSVVLNPGLDTSGGLVSLSEMLDGVTCFEVTDENGERIGSYAVQVVPHEFGAEAFVVAAVGSMPGADLVASVMPGIEGQARGAGCKSVAIVTRRRGLLAKARAQGYEFAGYILRKKL